MNAPTLCVVEMDDEPTPDADAMRIVRRRESIEMARLHHRCAQEDAAPYRRRPPAYERESRQEKQALLSKGGTKNAKDVKVTWKDQRNEFEMVPDLDIGKLTRNWRFADFVGLPDDLVVRSATSADRQHQHHEPELAVAAALDEQEQRR